MITSSSVPVIIFCHTYVYFICRRHEIQIQSEQVSQEATAKFLKKKKAWKKNQYYYRWSFHLLYSRICDWHTAWNFFRFFNPEDMWKFTALIFNFFNYKLSVQPDYLLLEK